MIVDGRAIAADILARLRARIAERATPPHLTVFACEPNFETQKFLGLKQKAAREVGITVNLIEFPPSVSTAEVMQTLAAHAPHTDGFVVQLPFPSPIDIDQVIAAIPASKDVDVLGYHGGDGLLPPVVGAIVEIAERHQVVFEGQSVVIVGQGRFVGAPAARRWPHATVVTEHTPGRAALLKNADILILGAGVPGLITPEQIKDGAILFDAGTSEVSGVLRGDADPACAAHAALFTPVPGGIGPITVAVLLRNLVELAERQ